MMQSNDSGKIDTLTVDWLNIWKHPKKQPRISRNIVSDYFYAILLHNFYLYYTLLIFVEKLMIIYYVLTVTYLICDDQVIYH
jgi:hypothetical protein